MNEFINKHPYITGVIVYITCKTLVNVAKVLKGKPLQPCIMCVITEKSPSEPEINETVKKEEVKGE